MARIAINLGTPPSGVNGDPVRTAFEKVNSMTEELYKDKDKLGTASTRDAQETTLDATGGRLMLTGSFGLGGGAVGAADMFALPACGLYYSNPGGGTLNPMTNAAGSVLHVATGKNSAGRGFQLWGGDNTFLFRGFTNGNHAPVRTIYHDGNAVGLMGAGAIIERGVTGNGEFVKFADGTLIATATGLKLTFTNSNVLYSDWIFPAVFAAGTSIVVTNSFVGDLATIRQMSGFVVGAASVSIVRLFAVSKAQFVPADISLGTFSAMAVGRWK